MPERHTNFPPLIKWSAFGKECDFITLLWPPWQQGEGPTGIKYARRVLFGGFCKHKQEALWLSRGRPFFPTCRALALRLRPPFGSGIGRYLCSAVTHSSASLSWHTSMSQWARFAVAVRVQPVGARRAHSGPEQSEGPETNVPRWGGPVPEGWVPFRFARAHTLRLSGPTVWLRHPTQWLWPPFASACHQHLPSPVRGHC